MLSRQVISGRDFKGPAYTRYGVADKWVHHLELSLEGSGLHYEPGDALGIVHRNPQVLVESVLAATGLNGDTDVTHDGHSRPLSQWLAEHRELTRISRPLLINVGERSAHAELARLLEPEHKAELSRVFDDHQLIDVLRRWPADWSADALVSTLRPATHRLYSIASSRKRVGEEVHLTVDELRYDAHGSVHQGAASSFLAALEEGGQLPVFIEANERFRVPADSSRDIIMIGPGTGVAPFRAFVQERAEIRATGRNWLFFGARHFNSDFLYQTEWQDALRRKELHRLDLAFSRDQADKVYVQQRLRTRGRDLYEWLQNGAHLYVCGAISMGKDVHAALLDVVREHGGLDEDGARDYLTQLHTEGRYGRDVY
ncbi:Sulfite reductase [NADPH] flavoprotein alpha-component [compost metagenome]